MDGRWVLTALVFVGTLAIGWMTLGLALTIAIPIAVVLAGVVLVADSAARRDDVSSTGYAGSTASLIQAAGVVLAVWAVWYYIDDPIQAAISYWWLFPLAIIGMFSYWYVQHRRDVASASTAIDRTQRTASRTVSSWTEFLAGIALLGITFVAAFATGILDAFAPYAGEIAYLGTVFLGYLSLGGEGGGDIAALIPELGPLTWVGVTLFLGGTALYIQHQA